ncbi:MAG: PQQ-binding-like beta-propeller repeat protein, partial [Planctomycetaceae bacterium]|nr:PQQ-binding-like beta-propeller repeat protein [Planctomycetaceae bacterium]
MLRTSSICCWILLITSSLGAENWPGWRGPQGIGTTTETGFPLQWSQEKNIRWRVALPGPGNSTPIVWQDRVFVTCATDKGKQRSLICFDRKTGKQQWKQSVAYEAVEVTHKTNPQCASSPVTDGQQVVAWFGSAGLCAYTMEGKQLWKRDLGKFDHIWGTASSPIIFEDLVILNGGPGL